MGIPVALGYFISALIGVVVTAGVLGIVSFSVHGNPGRRRFYGMLVLLLVSVVLAFLALVWYFTTSLSFLM